MKISQINSGYYNTIGHAGRQTTRNTAYNYFNAPADIVQFSGESLKSAKDTYEKLVQENSDNGRYDKPTVYMEDVEFLLDMDDDGFKKIITKPVECTDKDGRRKKSTIFFYTDGAATKKLLDKLDDKKAAFNILKTQNDHGYTALHAASFAQSPLKVKAICTAVDKNDLKTLMQITDLYEDDAYSVAIFIHNENVLNVFKKYHLDLYKRYKDCIKKT